MTESSTGRLPRDAGPEPGESAGVLLVDSGLAVAGGSRGSTFAALALSPGFVETASAGTGGGGGPERRTRYLVAPEVVGAAGLASLRTLDAYEVVVLMDVPRLPAEAATRLADFVSAGGGCSSRRGCRPNPGSTTTGARAVGIPSSPGGSGGWWEMLAGRRRRRQEPVVGALETPEASRLGRRSRLFLTRR